MSVIIRSVGVVSAVCEYPTDGDLCRPPERDDGGAVCDDGHVTQPPSAPWGDPAPPPAPQTAYGQVDDAAGPYAGGQPVAYAAPGAYGGYAPPPRPTTPTLGWVALVAGIVALVGSLVNGLVIASLLTPAAFDGPDSGNVAMLMSLGLANGLLLWFGFGLWAIIQGGVAIAQGRGRPQGIGAVLLGVVGPWVGVAIAGAAFVALFGTA